MKPEEAIAFLLDGHLLDARDLVQGEIRVEDRSARNRSFAVHCRTRAGLFLKQARPGDVEGTLETEALVYQRAQGEGPLAALKPFLPAFHHFDVERQLLTLELVGDAASARDLEVGSRGVSEIGEQLGRALAACHAAGTEDDTATRAAFSAMLPWAFRVALPEPDIYSDVWPLQLRLIQLVQRQRDVVERFRELRRGWQNSSFIHGDVRWTNVLITSAGELRIVDWEGAGIGDPAWDLSCAFEAWLARGIESLELRAGDGPADASAHFARSLPPLQQQMSLCWQAYAAASTLSPAALRFVLDRAVAYTGVRLLQSAYEWSRGRPEFTPFILFSIQLAVNLLRKSPTEQAAILGLRIA